MSHLFRAITPWCHRSAQFTSPDLLCSFFSRNCQKSLSRSIPQGGVERWNIRTLRVRNSGTTYPNCDKIFCACYLWLCIGLPLVKLQHGMYFRFSGWRHGAAQVSQRLLQVNSAFESDRHELCSFRGLRLLIYCARHPPPTVKLVPTPLAIGCIWLI